MCGCVHACVRACVHACVRYFYSSCHALGPVCPSGMVYKECGPNCPETCDNRNNNYDCQIIGSCSSGCYCPDGKVLSSNGTCIDEADCPGNEI